VKSTQEAAGLSAAHQHRQRCSTRSMQALMSSGGERTVATGMSLSVSGSGTEGRHGEERGGECAAAVRWVRGALAATEGSKALALKGSRSKLAMNCHSELMLVVCGRLAFDSTRGRTKCVEHIVQREKSSQRGVRACGV